MIRLRGPMVLDSEIAAEAREILSRSGVENLRGIRWSAADTSRLNSSTPTSKGARTAIIPVIGLIEQRQSLAGLVLGGVSTEQVGVEFMAAINDPKVNRVVLLFDTPGGSVHGTGELADMIYAARGTKEIISVVSPMAASGGLWIASQAPTVVIQPSGDIGSLGVVAQHFDESGALEKEGIVVTTIRSSLSPYKVETASTEPLTSAGKEYLQQRADRIFADFAGAVARGRGKTVGYAVENFGKGRLLDAQTAKRVGLVDHIATLTDVLTKPGMIQGKQQWSMSAAEWDRLVSQRRSALADKAAAVRSIVESCEKPEILAEVSGLVIPFNRTGHPSEAETEIIKPGALGELLSGSSDVSLTTGHDVNRIVAHRSDFSLRLSATDAGLHAAFDVPDTLQGRLLLKAIQDKRLVGWSPGIDMKASTFEESQIGGKTHRRFSRLSIHEISAIILGGGNPAYPMVGYPKVTLRKGNKLAPA